jgi:acetyltransferase-like isoleucine patch superfamily enzyme/RimJ/RimL family protein N-acetyltransferase
MHSDVQSADIGEGTQVWQYTVVLPKARIGRNCNINAHCFVENDVVIGDRVTVKCGVYLWDGIRIQDDVFIGPNATFINDLYPRSKNHGKEIPRTVLGKGCSIGANATVLAGRKIGPFAMVGAGSLVAHDVPPYALVHGSPARVQGHICKCGVKLPVNRSCDVCGRQYFLSPRGYLQDWADMKFLRGKHVNLRLVEMEDAEFIVSLRSDERSRKYLSVVSDHIDAQLEWTLAYKKREAQGEEFYYVIQLPDGLPVGLIRIYDLTPDVFSGGSWIIAPGQPHRIAVETVVLLYDLCFDQLGYDKVLLQVVKENQSVIKFHERFGAQLQSEDEKHVYLVNTYESMRGPRQRFKESLGLR